jgi:hypothetical protein
VFDNCKWKWDCKAGRYVERSSEEQRECYEEVERYAREYAKRPAPDRSGR